MAVKILRGDCRDVLRTLEPESVHCVVTSPPYWGLRDYGTAQWEGGNPKCNHIERTAEEISRSNTLGPNGYLPANNAAFKSKSRQFKYDCRNCGARRIDRQIGLEHDFAEYIESMVMVFREVKRVLRPDGTVWLNLGDSYAGHNLPGWRPGNEAKNGGASNKNGVGYVVGCKPKDLVGIPWRVAFALQADGWWLRSDIIWSKPNPMPESVTDRPTKAHEYLFLLAKSERYYYNASAIQEPVSGNTHARRADGQLSPGQILRSSKTISPVANGHDGLAGFIDQESRNRRSVWEVTTSPFPEAHFATFPPALIEPCILAGCPEKCCAKCGAPWVREAERTDEIALSAKGSRFEVGKTGARDGGDRTQPGERFKKRTLEAAPSCRCDAVAVGGTVLDPFGGAGTTGLVADRLGRNAILIELNPQYADMAERRIHGDCPLFAEVF